MNYSFKLSRRMARFRAAVPIVAIFLTLSCSDGPSGPGSNATPDPSRIAISPESVSVGPNQAVQFDAALDTSSPSFSKAIKGRGRKAVVSVAVAPQTMTVKTGTSNRFSATAKLSDGTTVSPSLSWTATGGTIDQTGLYTAGTTVGTYRVIAAATSGVADTADVTVATSTATPAQVTLSPATKTLVVGTTAQFTLVGKASDGSTVGVSPVFAATGGTITSAGLYTAGQTAGNYRVIATDQTTGLADTAAITVSPAPTWQSWAETPASVTLAPGKTQQFAVTATATDGSTINVTPTWKATGGTISSTGLYTAGQTAGSYQVIAVDTAVGRADTSAVAITTSTLQAVVLTPATVSLATGGTQQFAASGKMSDGSTAPITANFAATGGTISSTGLYTAGASAGTFRVIATQSGGTLADTAAVSITAPSQPPAGGTTYFLADGESGTVTPPWSYAISDPYDRPPTNSTTLAKHGTHSFKFEDGGVDGHYSQFLGGGPQVSMGSPNGRFLSGWYSFYAYVDAGYTSTAWNMLLGWMTGVSGAPNPISHIGLEVRNGQLQVFYYLKNCVNGFYACPAIPGYTTGIYYMTASSPAGIVPFPRGQWVHLAVYYKMAKTNGQVQIWQDGVKIMDLTAPTMDTFDGFSTANNTVNDMLLQFGMYGGGTATTGTQRLYVDDFRVSDYRPAP